MPNKILIVGPEGDAEMMDILKGLISNLNMYSVAEGLTTYTTETMASIGDSEPLPDGIQVVIFTPSSPEWQANRIAMLYKGVRVIRFENGYQPRAVVKAYTPCLSPELLSGLMTG